MNLNDNTKVGKINDISNFNIMQQETYWCCPCKTLNIKKKKKISLKAQVFWRQNAVL